MTDWRADEVTRRGTRAASSLADARPSLLPFDPKDMMGMRVTPAVFAGMCGVTKQSVSRWIKKGWVTLGVDGRLDPVAATRQYLSHADPKRVRARVFRDALATQAELCARIQSLEAEVVAERAAKAEMISFDDLAIRLDRLIHSIVELPGIAKYPGILQEQLVDLAVEHVMRYDVAVDDSRGTPPLDSRGERR